ncbi:MAG: T9SS type B sorting domain-containing protein [Ferruginibacter sp.]
MNKPRSIFKFSIFLLLLFTCFFHSFSQTFVPITVNGFNHDVIAESGSSSLLTTDFPIDGVPIANHVMYTASFGSSNALGGGGIPDNGLFTFANGSYQMADYTSNNALLLQRTETGDLNISSPAAFSKIRILTLSTEGESAVNVNLFFTDGSNTASTASVGDWFFNTTNLVVSGIGRCDRASPVTGSDGLPDNPRIYYLEINLSCADRLKDLQKINFTNVTTAGINAPYPNAVFFAVSGISYIPVSTSALINPATCTTAGNATLTLTPGTEAPYSVSWNTVPVQNGLTATNLQPGTYVATITDAASCTSTYSVTINGVPNTIPAFPPIDPICNNSVAPVLPTTSDNGITGTWSPSTISNTSSGSYTFTPAVGQCATVVTVAVTVTPNITPAFNLATSFCNGATVPILPGSSTNGITGTWLPTAISNTNSGTYVFSPAAGQCAPVYNLDVTITPVTNPTFSFPTQICQGSIAPVLPATSDNGVPGTWSPSIVSNTSSGSYTFTPNVGTVCTTNTTIPITVSSTITPLFPGINPICFGSVAPALPATSTNGLTGTWSPATVSNSSSGTYTFTPDAGQCGGIATLNVQVVPNIIPQFNAVTAICNGTTAPVLPAASLNGINGTWSPATVNNTISGIYTFTPDAGQCATTTTLPVTVLPLSTSTTILAICSSQLPFSWNGNVFNTAGAYAVVLTGSNGCDSTATLNLSLDNITSTTPETICSSQLPYSWNGNSYSAAGSYPVTLTSSGGCDSIATLNLTVVPDLVAPVVSSPVNYCLNQTTSPLTATTTSTGNSLLWYTTATGGTGSATAPVPSSTSIGNTDYYVSQVNGSCEGPRVLITVSVNSKPDLGADKSVTLCFGQTENLTLLYNTTGYANTWTLNQAPVPNPAIAGNSGSYQLIVSTGSCADTAIVQLNILPPVQANAGQDANIEYNMPYQLSGSGGIEYEWSPAADLNNNTIPNPVTVLTNSTTFVLSVKDLLGCTGTDSVKINVFKGPAYYIPTAFTPNGDGLNDGFHPVYIGIVSLDYFRVYNRYGQVIFSTSDLFKGWDGRFKGVQVNQGNYAWTLQGRDRSGKVKMLKGNIVLIR